MTASLLRSHPSGYFSSVSPSDQVGQRSTLNRLSGAERSAESGGGHEKTGHKAVDAPGQEGGGSEKIDGGEDERADPLRGIQDCE